MTKKKLIYIIAAVILIIAITAVVKSCGNGNEKIAADSVLACGADYIYYNDTANNIWRKNIYENKPMLFAKKLTLLAANNGEILATNGNDFIILDESGQVVDRVEGIAVKSAQITYDSIYYQHIDSSYIVKMDRETNDVKDVVTIAVNKFQVYENQIIFTTEASNMIFFYDMESGSSRGYFGDKLIGDFCVDGRTLYYSDINTKCNVIKMDLDNGNEVQLSGVQSQKFICHGEKLFYIENVGKSRKQYEIKEFNG